MRAATAFSQVQPEEPSCEDGEGSPRQRAPGRPFRLCGFRPNERVDAAPRESDESADPDGGQIAARSELVDHRLGHVQERGHILHVHERLAQDGHAGFRLA